jgi:UDP-N-acetylmuramoyl-tripeptide--D-alanyl-D-alanine ligase
MQRRLADAALAVGGRLLGADAEFGDVSTDTRNIAAGSLFVALRGPRFDAHEFLAAAAAGGAVGAIVDRVPPPATPAAAPPGAMPSAPPGAPPGLILVTDTLLALQRLAQAWRARFTLPIVGVAGSNGKTTTKEMTAAILARRGPVLATRGNLNNHIGVPMTLLRLEPRHRSAVVEMGTNQPGDVAALMPLVRPAVALITNAGAEHLEFFGDLDGVARGEGEAIAGLGSDGIAVLNADDAYVGYWRQVAGVRPVRTFGLREPADFTAETVAASIEDGSFVTRFTLRSPEGSAPIVLRAGGTHNLVNALAAAAAAGAAGASLEDMRCGLAEFRAVSGRLQLKPGAAGGWIIDDSYNANPDSVRAGLDVLGALAGSKWLVFGDMGELGAHAEASHTEVGAYARARGIERLFAVGRSTPGTVASFGAGGEWFADADALLRRLAPLVGAGVTVLVKGSRVNRLERVVAALTGAGAGSTAPLGQG